MASIEESILRLKTLLMIALVGLASLGGYAGAQDIYTCVDAKGRTITADRPIIDCLDRSQRELTRSGLVKRQLGPTLTAHEQILQDEKDKLAAEQRAREVEEKRRDRALLLRYPTRAVHDQERSAALSQIDEVIKASSKRSGELASQRKAIADELEFYVKNPSRAPASLQLRLQDNEANLLVQQKFVKDQEQEKKRVNLRFDEELIKLKQLWALTGPAANAGANVLRNSKN